MLVKIGSAFIDPMEIAAVMPDREDGLTELELATKICVTLKQGGSFWLDATMDEAEAALIDAGVIEDPYPDVLDLSSDEMAELIRLRRAGCKWIARDIDGKLFAYRCKPVFDGAYWDAGAPNDAEGVREGFDFIEAGEAEPYAIGDLLEACKKS